MTAKLGPLYLIRGDDHGAIAARRARLRALAESESDGSGLELLEGPEATPERTAQALASLTLALGRRVVIVDGVERWRTKDVEDHLLGAIGQIPPDTTLALFAREESRAKVPEALVKAVKRAGGQVAVEAAVKPWELPGWTREQAERLGLSLDARASKALVAQVGERPQRLLRELEKLALSLQSPAPGEAGGAGTRPRGQRRGGAAAVGALIRAAGLRARRRAAGGRPPRGPVAAGHAAGAGGVASRSDLRDHPKAARRRHGRRAAGRRGVAGERSRARCARCPREPRSASSPPSGTATRPGCRAALGVLADLELDSRGGSPLPAARRPQNGLEEDSLALRAVEAIAS